MRSKGSWSFGLSQDSNLATIEKVSWRLVMGEVELSYTLSNFAKRSRYLVKTPQNGWVDSETFPTDALLSHIGGNVFMWAHLVGQLHDEALELEKLAAAVEKYFENDVETTKAEALAKIFKDASDGLAQRLMTSAEEALARVQA